MASRKTCGTPSWSAGSSPPHSAMHGASDFRRHHRNRPGGPPLGHASPIPPGPTGPGHVDCRSGIMEPVKFRDTPPTWDIFLTQWLCILARWHEHPAPTLPTSEVRDMHKAITSLKETGSLQHPRLNQPHPSPPRLRNPRPKKRKKETYGPAMAAAHQKVIDEYVAEGWEAIYPDGSSETHPEAWWGGSGYFSGISGTRHNAYPSIKNKQTTGGNSWLPSMPFATEHHTSAHRSALIRNRWSWVPRAKPANGGATIGRAPEDRWATWICGSNCSRKLNRQEQQYVGCTSPHTLVLWETHT